MAMIICPVCGQQVSDKAKKCVHCGAVLIQEEKRVCTECGTELEDGATECPNCGCPIEQPEEQSAEEQPQKVEVTGVKVTKRVKLIIGIVVALLVIGGASVFGVSQYRKKKAAEEYAQRLEEYSGNLELAAHTMLSGASTAESCSNLIKQVWYNAIYKKSDSKTDKYTRPKGDYVSDFNEAIAILFADSSFSSRISDIEENKDTVNSLMKKLKNPPDEYKDAYDALSKLYDAYLTLTGCATDPSGSLSTYSSTFNDADTNTLNAYNAMKLYLDD